jgi:uncharacterized protein (DUF488 family)
MAFRIPGRFDRVKLYTIGFTEKSAERFFDLLKSSKIDVLVDTRLRPDGQLSGFAKQGDLPFFLRELAGADYVHLPILAPEDDILKEYRSTKDWGRYEQRFEQLMNQRGIPDVLDKQLFHDHVCCLLCSEAKPIRCHRRLVAERMSLVWGNVDLVHLT